jgi:hypothetical protein
MTDELPTDPAPSPDVARDIQRDAFALARSDAWLNAVIAMGMVAATAFVAFGMFFAESRNAPRDSSYSLIIQFAIIDVVAIFAAIRSWRRYRQLGAAVATDTIVTDEDVAPAPMPPPGHLFMIGSRPVILILVLGSLGFQWQRQRATTGPIVFRNASITTNTGFVEERMTVAVANGRIAFVGHAEDSIPLSLTGARNINANTALVSAATFDHSAASPADALRHTWVGQVYEGAPGDLIISSYTPFRGRNRTPAPRELLGAVVNGRYYTATQLQKQ